MHEEENLTDDEGREFFQRVAAEDEAASEAVHEIAAGSRRSQNDSAGYRPRREESLGAGLTQPRDTDRQRRMDPQGGWLPGDDMAVDPAPPRGQRPERKTQRLGIRLQHSQYSMLKSAAELYGVRPTTMARMLINRGAQAVIRSYVRSERDLEGSSEYD